ncbi:hypothetical protein [Tychonema sp. BBK16]|uniref:hypothetical protein n=1 Tax=Tychonema sp. BBK16 TaxID=2699888 RepID=UPI001F1E13BA|nr:hypothetical protein [Tychonema sp. BBK16]MCF6374538.1 hypothetical protein [Tychonema sp. BBK16]
MALNSYLLPANAEFPELRLSNLPIPSTRRIAVENSSNGDRSLLAERPFLQPAVPMHLAQQLHLNRYQRRVLSLYKNKKTRLANFSLLIIFFLLDFFDQAPE